MAENETVSPLITDGATQTSVATLATTPSYGLAQTGLAFAQSQGVLFANMTSEQQRQASASAAAIMKCVQILLEPDGGTEDQGGKLEMLSGLPPMPRRSVKPSDADDKAEDTGKIDPFFGKLDDSFCGGLEQF